MGPLQASGTAQGSICVETMVGKLEAFWSRDIFIFLTMINGPQELLTIWVISVNIYCIGN